MGTNKNEIIAGSDADETNVPSGIGPVTRRIATHRVKVVGSSGVGAGLLTIAVLTLDGFDSSEGINWSTTVGLLMTIWSFFLAYMIYLLSARDTNRIMDQVDELVEQLSAVATSSPQTASVLHEELTKYPEYIAALRREVGHIPETDLTSVARPPGKGNSPLIIETKQGKRYSVYRGRGAGFTVTKLPKDTD